MQADSANLITQAEFARRRKVSIQAISDLVKRGVITLIDGRIDEEKAMAQIARSRDPAYPGKIIPGLADEPEENISFHIAKTRREMAEAKLAETKLARQLLEVAPITILQDALTEVAQKIAAILDALPARIKLRCPELPYSELEFLTREIIACREICANVTLDLPPDELQADSASNQSGADTA